MCAIQGFAMVDGKKAVPIYYPQFVNLVMEYSQFFLYLFYFLLSDEKVDKFTFHTEINIWKSIVCSSDSGGNRNPNLTSKRRLVDSFRRWNLVPGISSEENLLFMIEKVSRPQRNPNPIDYHGDDKMEINFMQFLWLLDLLTQPNLEPETTTSNASKLVEWKTQKVVRLISSIAEKLLLATISRFSNSENSLMSATSFMWLMRQSRLTLIIGSSNPSHTSHAHDGSGRGNKDSVLWWLEQIEHYAEPGDISKVADLTSQHSHLDEEKYLEIKISQFSLAVFKMVYILFRIVEKRVVIPMR